MRTLQLTPGRVAFHTVLIGAVLAVWCLGAPVATFADDPPTPPPAPPTRTYTPTPEDPTDTPEPSDTPEPTDTPVPTDTPIPTDTPVPSDTPVLAQTAAPAESPPGAVGTTGPKPAVPLNSECQSAVSGSVFTLSGIPAAGATVLIEGADWSDATASDDAGLYGFNQLCPGKASLQAFLADGQVSQLAELDLNGRDPVQVVLSVASAGAAVVDDATSEPTLTPEPDMPVTGYGGWLLVGGGMMAAFLLLVAGARRAIAVRERSGGRD